MQKQIDNIIHWIRDYFICDCAGTENTKAVIGISGGKDSTVAAALLVRALGPDRVVGVMMPEGSQKDIADAKAVIDLLGITGIEVNIGGAMRAMTEAIPDELFGTNNEVYYCNTPARLRMTALYGVAGLIGGRVCNTGNKSELYVGYTTKYGDLAGDFALFTEYTMTEVVEIGDALGLPYDLVHKEPSDGMSGKTDEDKLGLTYKEIDDYLINDKVPAFDKFYRMQKLHRASYHKNVIRLPHPYKQVCDYRSVGKEVF